MSGKCSLSHRMVARLCERWDIASLAVFRVVFGAAMFWQVCLFFPNNHIARDFIAPQFFFTYYGFSWGRPWPGIGYGTCCAPATWPGIGRVHGSVGA